MKVKCIRDDCGFITKDKIYDVHLDDHFQAYIIDDTNSMYLIGYENDYLEIIQKKCPSKTLRDEFAMAAINAMGHKYDFRKMVEYTSIAEVAYEMADEMLKVREEND